MGNCLFGSFLIDLTICVYDGLDLVGSYRLLLLTEINKTKLQTHTSPQASIKKVLAAVLLNSYQQMVHSH